MKPEKSFYALVAKKGPPSRIVRWCCDEIKKKPSYKHPLKHRIMGIRAEESYKRSVRPRIDSYKNNWTIYKPIFNWTESDVWEFIESNGLKYPSMYDEGFSRIGCVVCPFHFYPSVSARRNILTSMDRWPGIWRAFENSCRKWFDATDQITSGGLNFENGGLCIFLVLLKTE